MTGAPSPSGTSTAPIRLRIDGKPTGKGRPRFVKATGRAYTPAATLRAEQRLELAWITAGRPRLPDGPVRVVIEVVESRPANHWRVDGSLSAAGLRSWVPMRRPDMDNVLKLIGDSLNGLTYHDDAHIVDAHITRRWADRHEPEHVAVLLDAWRPSTLHLSQEAA